MMWFGILVVTSFLINADNVVSGLRCYACSSLNYSDCWNNGTSLTTDHVVDCNDRQFSCMVRVTNFYPNNIKFIGRHCQPKDICSQTLRIPGNIMEACEICETDLCNSFLLETSAAESRHFHTNHRLLSLLVGLMLSWCLCWRFW